MIRNSAQICSFFKKIVILNKLFRCLFCNTNKHGVKFTKNEPIGLLNVRKRNAIDASFY